MYGVYYFLHCAWLVGVVSSGLILVLVSFCFYYLAACIIVGVFVAKHLCSCLVSGSSFLGEFGLVFLSDFFWIRSYAYTSCWLCPLCFYCWVCLVRTLRTFEGGKCEASFGDRFFLSLLLCLVLLHTLLGQVSLCYEYGCTDQSKFALFVHALGMFWDVLMIINLLPWPLRYGPWSTANGCSTNLKPRVFHMCFRTYFLKRCGLRPRALFLSFQNVFYQHNPLSRAQPITPAEAQLVAKPAMC